MFNLNRKLDESIVKNKALFEDCNLLMNLKISFLIRAEQLETFVYAQTVLFLSNLHIISIIFNMYESFPFNLSYFRPFSCMISGSNIPVVVFNNYLVPNGTTP